MMAVMELVDRPGRPLYHVEHYIGGHYSISSHILMMASIELADRPGTGGGQSMVIIPFLCISYFRCV
jgi:hypothetical protein